MRGLAVAVGLTPVLAVVLGGCHPCHLEADDYAPVAGRDWPVSTPEAEGLDPEAVRSLFCEGERRDTLYGVVVAKNGKLVGERYYNAGSIDERGNRQSVTKSYTSALAGAAIHQGCLSSVDAPVIDFFPEHADTLGDPRKRDITIEHMLQMRAGFGWEEDHPELWELLWTGSYIDGFDDVPLVADPGTEHHYSSLTAQWLGIALARACDEDLRSFGEQNLFQPIGAEVGPWLRDVDGYYTGAGEIEFTARDMAKLGQLYLDDGVSDGARLLPEGWVDASLASYSSTIGHPTPGPEFEDWGYGYMWWSARAGEHRAEFAWGHGGNFIFVVRDLDLVVVVTADPFYGQDASPESWPNEKAHLNMVGAFLGSLSGEG